MLRAPKSAVEAAAVKRLKVKRWEVKRWEVKHWEVKPLAMERMLRDGLPQDGLLREPAGQGWGGWMQEGGVGREAPGWHLRLELPLSSPPAGAAAPTAPHPAG